MTPIRDGQRTEAGQVFSLPTANASGPAADPGRRWFRGTGRRAGAGGCADAASIYTYFLITTKDVFR